MQTDLQLFEAWASGDQQAGNQLCQRHLRAMYRFFRNKLDTGAEDLVQRTFTACFEARDRFEGRSSFRTFLYGVARNMLLAEFRTRNRAERRVDFSTQSVAELVSSPSGVFAFEEEKQLLYTALRRIPVDFQLAIELYYWEELNGPELAEVLGLSEPGVRSRLRRAKAALRKELESLPAPASLVQSSLRTLRREGDSHDDPTPPS